MKLKLFTFLSKELSAGSQVTSYLTNKVKCERIFYYLRMENPVHVFPCNIVSSICTALDFCAVLLIVSFPCKNSNNFWIKSNHKRRHRTNIYFALIYLNLSFLTKPISLVFAYRLKHYTIYVNICLLIKVFNDIFCLILKSYL